MIEKHIAAIITALGDDINRPGLRETPSRVAESWQYLTNGYRQDLASIVNGAIFESNMDEMVIVKDIELYSLCEHHLLPFVGKCHVAYMPKGKIIGISKIARIIDHFARRLQIQEQLTEQIAHCVQEITSAAGVGVIIEAKHFCMMMRGVEKQNAVMKTSMMLGTMRSNQATRMEFLSLVK